VSSSAKAPPQGNAFAADLLERAAGGYAGFATSLMLQRDPELVDRMGPSGQSAWRAHLTQRVLELAAAVAAGDERLFTGRVTWSRKAFRARGQRDADIRSSLEALRDVLEDKLPSAANAEALAYLDAALGCLDGPVPEMDPCELDPERPADRLALQYLQQILEGNAAAAIRSVAEAAADGLGPQAVYLQVLMPAQREVGRLWHAGDLTIAEEHMVTATTQRAMAVIAAAGQPAQPHGRTVLLAAVAGNVHDIGLRALGDLYQLDGWRVIFVGSDVPTQELPTLLTFFEVDLLVLGATLGTHVPRVEQAIRSIRERCERPVKVIVGGSAFDEAPDLWQRVGADGYGAKLDEAVSLGGRLVGL
jgi:methanogenic corrinoid protein MtbC1